jgi:hypothetical protein
VESVRAVATHPRAGASTRTITPASVSPVVEIT